VANLARITSVQIALATAGLRQHAFSDILLVGTHTGPDRVSLIADSDELLEAPFSLTDTDPLYLAASVAFSQEPCVNQVYIGRRDSGESAAVVLAACSLANDAWYGFSLVDHLEADLISAATWAEANQKLFLAVITDSDVGTAAGANPADALVTGNYFRTPWWYTTVATQFPEVAAASKAFTVPPGGGGQGVTEGGTWANMTLRGVTATTLTETQYTYIKGRNGNTFEPFRNLSLTQGGKTAGGEWIDIIRGRDWLCEEIRVQVFLLFVDKRVPYTDQGIAAIRQRMDMALAAGVRRGLIAPRELDPVTEKEIPSYIISVPSAADVSQNDKANRVLKECTFRARLAGAIHAVELRGSLTYDKIS